MKFNIVNLGYKSTPDYPYDYRIEILEYKVQEKEWLEDWLFDHNIPHIIVGYRADVYYLRKEHATMFALRWA